MFLFRTIGLTDIFNMKFMRSTLVSLLTFEARLALATHRPKIVAITGNLGKTTTKDAIFAVVSARLNARKSLKSFNSDIGVPLAILGLGNPWSNPLKWLWTLVRGFFSAISPGFPELLVLEVGADKPGDIASIAKWLQPDTAVFTGVPKIPVHIAYFDSADALMREKMSLFEYLRSNGTIVANGDNERSAELLAKFSQRSITYGFGDQTVAAADPKMWYDYNEPLGMTALLKTGETLRVRGVLGKPPLYAALAALAIASELGIERSSALRSIENYQQTPGRMRILKGINGSVIIDDSYNSSPAAALSALKTLKEIRSERKIAVLGDMRELGGKSVEAHLEIGAYAANVADLLITVGEESRVLAQAARDAGMPKERIREYGYDSSQEVGQRLAKEVRAGDVVLVKGSQNRIRLERCVYELLPDRSQAARLLVRFDPAWRKKA